MTVNHEFEGRNLAEEPFGSLVYGLTHLSVEQKKRVRVPYDPPTKQTPMKTIRLPVKIKLDPIHQDRLRVQINKHYLDDDECSELKGGILLPKYPEKETDEFVDAHFRIGRDYNIELDCTFDHEGKLVQATMVE